MRNVTKICYLAYRQGLMPSRAIFIFLLAGGLFCLAATCPVEAATYYCDPVDGNTVTGDGNSGNPWGTLQSVNIAGKFNGVIIKSGDTVKLRTGFHGRFVISSKDNTDYITIEADDGAVADVNYVQIKYSDYWCIRGLRISPEFDGPITEPPTSPRMVRIVSGNNYITVEDCNIFTVTDTSLWEPNDWDDLSCQGIDAGNGILTGGIIRNNLIRNVSRGMTSFGCNNFLIENNTIDGFSVDGIVTDGTGQIIQDNRIINVYGDNNPDTHSDAIHVSGNNIIIRRNYICARTDPNRTSGGGLQGIYLNGANNPLTNSTIENNVVMVNNGVWGIVIGAYSHDTKILNNTVLRPYNTGNWPDINLNTGVYNIIVRNNIADNFPANDPSRNLVVDHNFDISNYNPLVEFVDYVHGNVHLAADSNFIDKGLAVDVNAPTDDLDGLSRPQGTYFDIGAYEYIPIVGSNDPELDTIGNKSVNENSTLTFDVNACDVDGDTIVYSCNYLPSGATFSVKTFAWMPTHRQSDSYQVRFYVSDGKGGVDSELITITVNNVPRYGIFRRQ